MTNLTIDQLTQLLMKQAENKGFGTKPEEIDVPEKIALIHSEISEAYEAYRHKNFTDEHGFYEELGDAIQRILHLCGIFQIDIEKYILQKVENNHDRNWDWDKTNEKHS